ncbi:MAG: ABC transporter permease [Balneolaceae bacterium]
MFDLEKEIKEWKRKLRKNSAYEDGDIEELESHLRDKIDELIREGISIKEAYLTAVGEIGDVKVVAKEFHKTSTSKTYLDFSSAISWGILRNFIKIFRRNIQKNKLYSSLNIFGLIIGITSALFIYLFVQNEMSYDNYHEKGERIYKVNRVMEREVGSEVVGVTSMPFKDALKEDFPDMIALSTQVGPGEKVVEIGDETFMERRFYYADENYFKVFSYPFLMGDPETALRDPGSVVISKETALKYFDNIDAVGRYIETEGNTFLITGVFEYPENTNNHLEFDIVLSLSTYTGFGFTTNWWSNWLHTSVLMEPQVSVDDLTAQLPAFTDKYLGENMVENNRRVDLTLIPLKDVYFANYVGYDNGVKHGSKSVVYIFGLTALLIILVAGVNFVNLATARSVNRAKEIGVRKTLGAEKSTLFFQFIGEAIIITCIAGIISYLLVFILNPYFQNFLQTTIPIQLFSFDIILIIASSLLLIGFLAGLYPALFLSSFSPIKALKEKVSFGISQLFVRKGLIIFQFTVSSLLIIGVSIIGKQLDYLNSKSLGFEPSQLVDISLDNDNIGGVVSSFQAEIARIPGVETSSAMSGTPGGFYDRHPFRVNNNTDQMFNFSTLFIDENFAEVFGFELLAGRDFDASYSTDSSTAIIINEKTANYFGWSSDEALGKSFHNQVMDESPRFVVGVVEDFHFNSLREEINPLIISMSADHRQLLVKVSTNDIKETLVQLNRVWDEFSPNYPIEYQFLNEQFAQLYESETRQGKVFSIFSVITILIACLGLFGLATFNAQKRSKEMGIRKVLGASGLDLLISFNKEVLSIVIISFLIAAPVTYFLAEEWLKNYAYRIDNGILVYGLTGVSVILLAIVTVSYQTLKIAKVDPVYSLKSE